MFSNYKKFLFKNCIEKLFARFARGSRALRARDVRKSFSECFVLRVRVRVRWGARARVARAGRKIFCAVTPLLILTRKTRGFMAKHKQIGLQNYLKFGPVNFSPMKLFVKALKVQNSASTSLQKWLF